MNVSILSRRGFSLDRLAGFCAVADAGSIVGAARDDVVRQSLLSRQIRELEECFETELVRRQGRGLVLTDAGRQLAALGRSQIAALDDFAAVGKNLSIRVSLAAPESAYQWVVLPRLAAMRRAAPGVTFVVHHEENAAISPRVTEGAFDFGIVRRSPARGEKGIAALGRMDYVLAAPRALVRGRNWSLADAMRHLPLALPIAGAMREAVDQYAARGSIALLDIPLEFTSYLHAAAALRSGACAAILPSVALTELPADRYVSWDLGPLKIERPPFSLIWSPRTVATRPVVAALAGELPGILKF